MRKSRRPAQPGIVRRFLVAACIASLGAIAAAAPGDRQQGQKPKPDGQEQKPAAQQKAAAEQQPTFRTEANFVRVDVYPTADGRPVQDLKQADFQVFEDGQRQEVRTFEHVLIQAGGPQETRSEPTSVRQSQEMVADPRARLFVLFLDTYHITREAAWNVRRSLSRLLERTISPTDFVALMTPEMSAASITFTRRTGSIDEVLDKWVNWGRRFEADHDPDPVEARYQYCYPPKVGESMMSALAREMIDRRREKLTIDAMRDLVLHLQGLREERKAILMVSEGWALYRPNSNLARMADGRVPGPPPVGVGPGGGMRVGDLGRDPGGSSSYECDQDRMRLAQEDHYRDFRDLTDEANRGNSTFYTIDPRGLPVFDTPISAGPVTSPLADQAMLGSRQEALRTLAAATDGVAVMNNNDIDKGLKRVVDDLTSYYLLGYYSSTAKADGRFHAISVKVTRPGVSVRARRGYKSPTKEELEAVTRGASGGKTDASPAAKAVTSLSKVRTDAAVHATGGYEWVAAEGGAARPSLWLALELDSTAGARDEQWKAGADVAVVVTGADKSTVGQANETLKREARSVLLHIPTPEKLPADYAIRVTSKPAGAMLGSTETIRVVVPKPGEGLNYGQPLLYRRGPFSGTTWQVAGDPRYRRQERVKVEIPVLGSFTSAGVVLLDRNGTPLSNIPVVSATREENGRKIVSGEVTLAPLTTGDYVLETTIKQGETTQKVLAPFRIIP